MNRIRIAGGRREEETDADYTEGEEKRRGVEDGRWRSSRKGCRWWQSSRRRRSGWWQSRRRRSGWWRRGNRRWRPDLRRWF
ncbi:hypothetical protein M5689_007268 [Euphorbia peplus]|nr:hypothetical protein M5689_007268 [Euphorbia peplus]